MSGQIGEPDRDRLADQQAQDPPALRKAADPADHPIVHAGVHELLQAPVAVKHTERRIPGADQLPGRRDDVTQHHRQPQVASHQRIRTKQPAQAALCGPHVIGALHQLFQQLIQLEPGHVRKPEPVTRVRRPRAARIAGPQRLRSGRRRTSVRLQGGHRAPIG